ncbi:MULTISPECIES: GvpL/GvpF family gas vesicle protein [unclassified Streptomyces]|uniref:GvpL/GvpF family gas vesicle protein n=1 Tax=unclassified Streptomyces TaxID=2593676 RepID=UPI0004CA0646|nr:GvpL/GvpF family gas vesicle protein [Streptomyces sp. NRRL F-5630]
MSAPGLYVYAVVPEDTEPAGLSGVGSPAREPRAVRAAGLAALVGPAPAPLRAKRRDLLAHQRVLDALAARGPVVPMRFGVVVDDEEAVREDLRRGAERYRAALEHVTGRVEVNIKGTVSEEGLPALLRADARLRGLRDEARARPGYEAEVRLGRAVAEGLTRRAREAAGAVRAALEPLAVESCQGAVDEGTVLNGSWLVDADRLDAFRAEAGRLAGRSAPYLALVLTGPLPCYSFVAAPPVPVGA